MTTNVDRGLQQLASFWLNTSLYFPSKGRYLDDPLCPLCPWHTFCSSAARRHVDGRGWSFFTRPCIVQWYQQPKPPQTAPRSISARGRRVQRRRQCLIRRISCRTWTSTRIAQDSQPEQRRSARYSSYNDARPRVRSADAFPAFASQSIALDNGDIGRHTRSSRPNRRSIKQQRGMQSFTMNGRGDLSQSSAFSDEYDLCKFSLGSPCVVC